MPFNKPHLEFLRLDPAEGWEPAPGYPPGTDIHQRILASDLNDETGTGGRVNFRPSPLSTAIGKKSIWRRAT
jgi:hypothetical protein